jgi:prefoldin subunit 5
MTGYAKAASGSSIATSDTLNQAIGKLEASVDDLNSQSETIAAALVDLSTNKLDASALTEVNSAISDLEDIVGSGYTNTTITAVIENMDQAVAAAITDLNDKIGDIESILATI